MKYKIFHGKPLKKIPPKYNEFIHFYHSGAVFINSMLIGIKFEKPTNDDMINKVMFNFTTRKIIMTEYNLSANDVDEKAVKNF